MKQRTAYFSLDDCFEEYCTSKCPIHKDIYMGSIDCHKCKEFISEMASGGGSFSIIKCKK